MTEKEFDTEFQIGKYNNRTGYYIDIVDHHYACEIWYSMTEAEKEQCTPARMDAYIQDTYDAIADNEMYEEA